MKQVDYNQAPLLLIWEITRACALACRHCRASAEDIRDPLELTTEEGFGLIDQVADMGTPLIVFTGGDPLQREDLDDLIVHARDRGLQVGTIPATTSRLTRERVFRLKETGLHQMAVCLDGHSAELHDDFRRVPGSFAKAMEGCAWAHEAGIPLQVNSVFGSWNAHHFDKMAALVESLGIVFWEVFFLVPTGRGSLLQAASGAQMLELFEKLFELMRRVSFHIKITEGQHFRVYVARRLERDDTLTPAEREKFRRFLMRPAVNAGRGFCFVDHRGNICPSGFLPRICGNVRQNAVADIYRHHPDFVTLRDSSLLEGACGACAYRDLCTGGSRSRAAAVSSSLVAEEPFCPYVNIGSSGSARPPHVALAPA